MFRNHLSTFAAGIFSLVVASAAFAQEDKIYQATGAVLSVKIEDESLLAVSFKQGPATSSVGWDKVQRIDYGAGNGPFAKALESMNKGDYAAAAALLEPLKPEREIFNPRRLFFLGKCNEGMGKSAEAEKLYNELASKYEKNYYTKLAIRSLVEVQIKNKNFPGAVASAEKGGQIAASVKNGALVLEFRYIKGTVLEAQEKSSEAEAEYRAVSGSTEAGRIAKLADCGLARLAAKGGDVDKVKSLVDPILKGNDPVLLPAAYAAMGEALLSRGTTEKNVEKLIEAARENFLRVVVQCPPPSNESQDDLERAMYGFARACKRLSEVDNKQKDTAEYWNQQTLQTCAEFKTRFPSSRFMKQVEELRQK